jgi:hypothetical protein
VNGPEHYKQAEQMLADITETPEDTVGSVRSVAAQAQVHATLALAAATALGRIVEGTSLPNADRQAWLFAARTDPKETR